jgi:hypothetical protein
LHTSRPFKGSPLVIVADLQLQSQSFYVPPSFAGSRLQAFRILKPYISDPCILLRLAGCHCKASFPRGVLLPNTLQWAPADGHPSSSRSSMVYGLGRGMYRKASGLSCLGMRIAYLLIVVRHCGVLYYTHGDRDRRLPGSQNSQRPCSGRRGRKLCFSRSNAST